MEEIWKDVPDYEGYYKVSNLGRIKSVLRHVNSGYGSKRKVRERILKPSGVKYLSVELCKDGIHKYHSVHRLVAIAFIPNIYNKPCIDHIDTNPKNNRVDNLRWVTHSENLNNEITSKRNSERQRNDEKKSFPVFQLDLNNNLLKEFPSMSEAERQTGIEVIDIKRACLGIKGRKTAGGYKWKLKDKQL